MGKKGRGKWNGINEKRELHLHFPSPKPSTTCSFMASSEVK